MSNLYLVTGGAGFIGSHIVNRLVEDGKQVRVVDNLCTGNIERLTCIRPKIEFVEADLASPQACEDVVDRMSYVIHQAAIPSVQRSICDPIASNRANVTATLNLLEACRKRGVEKFVYAASSSAYGDTPVLPKREDMPANPLSPYGLQKFVGECYCQLYHRLFGLETVCLRYFNVFGPGQDPASEYSAVIPKFISRLIAGQPLTVYGDGEQSRDFTYIDNVVEANLRALQAKRGAGEVFNIGGGRKVSLNQMIQHLENIIGVKARVEYAAAREGDVRDSLADVSKARDFLGYEPRIGFEEGLRRTVEYFRNAANR